MGKPLLHRKDTIILASVEVINELGIQGLTTREVAKRQGITEAAIFKHFRTKNELLLAVLDHYSQYDADIIETVRLKKLEPLEAISFVISSYAEYYQNYPQITAITQAYDVLASEPELTSRIKEIFLSRSDSMQALIIKAQEANALSKAIDSEMLSQIIWGTFRSACLKWRLSEYAFPLKEYVMSILKMTLDAFTLVK